MNDQLAELKRELAERVQRRDELELLTKRVTKEQIEERNERLRGAIRTMAVIADAFNRKEPSRRELVDAFRKVAATCTKAQRAKLAKEIALLDRLPQ